MARIKKLADIEDVLAWFSAEGEFLPAEGRDIKSGLEKIFNLDQVREWFAGDYSLFSECTIISRNILLRPDRVMVKGNEVTIIDFKTGQKQKEHCQQMERYRKAIKQMGYPEVEAYLLYIDDPEVVRI